MIDVVHTTVFSAGPGGGNPCPVVLDADALAPTRISVDQRVPVRSEANPSASDVAAVLGAEVVGPPESWSASRPKLIAPVADVDALDPSFEALWELCDEYGTTGVYAFDARLNARQFPVRAGYPEDAATGVAAAALGGYLAAHTPPAAPGTVRYEIAQGEAMGRPSRLTTVIDWDGSAVTRVRVEGDVEILGRERI